MVDQAITILQNAMASGALQPGTRLIESQIAEQIHVSRGTLREALRILEQKGLVTSIPGRGCYVALLTDRDIQEVYSLRSVLEQEAVRKVALTATDGQIAALQEILNRMLDAADRGELAQVVEEDLNFHKHIWLIADHRRILEILEGLIFQLRNYLTIQSNLYRDLAAGIADHKEIMAAILERDGEKAARVIKVHLEEAMNIVGAFAKDMTSNKGKQGNSA